MFKNKVLAKYHVVAKQMTWTEYTDQLYDQGDLDEVVQDMYHSGGYDEKKLEKYIENSAEGEGITLVYDEEFNDDVLLGIYKSMKH